MDKADFEKVAIILLMQYFLGILIAALFAPWYITLPYSALAIFLVIGLFKEFFWGE